MAIHGHVCHPEQVWCDTLKEAHNEAKRMSKEMGSASIIRSKRPADEEGSAVVYFVEHDPGMMRTWEREVAFYADGSKA